MSLESTPALANADLRHFRERYSRTPQQSDEQLRHLIASYHGMTSLIDHNVGRILIALLKGPMKYDGLLRLFLPSHMGFH
ncbi:MAG: hypothetical protein ACREFN_00460 [Acetobacteraceae bacterium]